MNEREAFIEVIAANPGEDTPCLAFADWLQEHGEEARAEFIRLACELGRREYQWDDRRKRADLLALQNWPEWFSPLFRALGMPEPELPAVPPTETWEDSICGPYRFHGSVMNFNLLRVRLADEEEPDEYSSPPRGHRFLNYLGFSGGLVTHLYAALGFCMPGCSLAEAFRLEPIRTLTLELDADPGHWHAITHPCLQRVRELTLELPTYGAWNADYSNTTSAVLEDESLLGVRELAFLGVNHDRSSSCPTIDYRAERPVVDRMMQTAVANAVSELRVCVGSEAALAVAEAPALKGLRSLDLGWNRVEDPGAFALRQYRDQLEELDLLENVVSAEALASGKSWARLHTLRLTGDFFLNGEFETFARGDVFPTLTRLSLSTDEMTQVSSSRAEMGLPPLPYDGLAAQFRRAKFPRLTHLSLTGYELPDNAMIALAEMAKRLNLRELDLRYTSVEDETKGRIRDLLGARVLLAPPRAKSG